MARGYGDDMNRDRWRDEDRERSSYGGHRDDDRGFFERAGDHLRSWFGEDDDRDPGRDYQRDTSWNRNQQSSGGRMPDTSWDRDQNRAQRSAWENDENRSSRPQGGGWRGGSSWDQSRRSGGVSSRDRESNYGRLSSGGYGQPGGSWNRDQGRGDYGQSTGSWTSSSDRDRARSSGFGGFRDESDFRGQHRRDHPQSWGEANRGENESLGYSGMGGTLGGFGNQTFGSSEHDHYRNWRDREMSKLDREYEDYCREREQKFNQDFDGWRRNRQSQSPSASANASSSDLGASSNAGVGTTTASLTGTAGSGSAIGSATGTGGSIQSDTTRSTETADAGSPTGGRPGTRSRS